MEKTIGQTFKSGHIRLIVVGVCENSCEGCYFEASNGHKVCMNENGGECIGLFRSDNRNVIFKPVKTTKTARK